jgi:hypothetical protein
MTLEEYNSLDDQTKKVFLFEADKVAERNEGLTKIQLYKIDDFFIETRRNIEDPSRRLISTFQG